MIDKGGFGIVNVYMNDIRAGAGTFFRDRNDVLRGAMLLDRDVVMKAKHIFGAIHQSYFSFEDENTGEFIGYYVYTSGTLEVGPLSSNMQSTDVTFRKALIDVKPYHRKSEPEFKYVGMEYDE